VAIARAQTWRLRRSCWPAARLAANACGCHETEPTSCVLFQNRLPLKDSTFRGALDELGVARRETVDVLMLAQDKRPESTLVGIGTPPPDGAATTNRQPEAPGARVVIVMSERCYA